MTRRLWAIAAAVALIVLGIIGLVTTSSTTGNVRSYIGDSFDEVSSERQGSSRVYRSDAKPSDVVAKISDKWKPAEQRFEAAGWLLRYQRVIVAVTARDEGGSTIFVDSADRGYARWYPYLGGWWGPYSGGAEDFRGGGPGAGK
jgi:hypothetical protein